MQRSAGGEEFYMHPHNLNERQFIEWVESATGFRSVSFHTFRYLRNGITLLQRELSVRSRATW